MIDALTTNQGIRSFWTSTAEVPSEVGGTLEARAAMFAAKFSAQFTAGVVGELAWAWNKDYSTLSDFDIGPGDPSLAVLAAY